MKLVIGIVRPEKANDVLEALYRAEVRGAPLELRPTRANGQPAFGCYLHSRAWGVLALTLSGEQIAEITFFSDPSLVNRFGLPRQI